jgi:predicted nucleic acid-binding protein
VAVIVVDASVVIGFLDAQDPHHRRAVAALTAMGGESLVLPASAYAEILILRGVFPRQTARRDRDPEGAPPCGNGRT